MIDDALEYIRKELVEDLPIDEAEAIVGNIHALKSDGKLGLYISLVNLEEEGTLKNTPHFIKKNNQIRYKQPPVFLNLYTLFATNFLDYGTSLLHLSQTIEFFQNKSVFSADNQSPTNVFPASLEKIIFDFYNLSFEKLNHLWGVLSGEYFPSVMYKVRLVKVQRDESVIGPEITTIQVETSVP